MRNLLYFAGLLGMFLPLSSHAEQLPSPIEIDPDYKQCLNLAEGALGRETSALEVEANTLGAQGVATPAELPKSKKHILPGLDGHQDFETALKEKGVRIIIDPENPQKAPRVELDNVMFAAANIKAAQPEEEVAEEVLSEEDIYQQKRHVCRIKFGIHF